MRAASCTQAVPMLVRAFSADRSALVARWLLKIAYKMASLPDDVQKIFSAARAERMAPSGADGFFEGRRAAKGSWHVEKVRLVALGAPAFLRWPSSQ